MSKPRAKQQNFSVAQKYEQVWDILDTIENKSEYICQAIIEKFNKVNEEANNPEDIDKNKLKSLIKETLNEMIEEDMFIVKGNIKSIESVSLKGIKDKIEEPEEEVEEEISDDVKEAVRNIIGNW